MRKFKKVMSAVIAAVFSLCLTVGGINTEANDPLYNNSYTLDNIENYFIIGLEGDPISCNQSAREMGVMNFILTDEGKTAYQEIMAQHESVKNQISDILGRKLDVKYDYTSAYNGFSIAISLNEAKKIESASKELGVINLEFGSAISSSSQNNNQKNDTRESASYSDITDKIFEKTGITQSGLDGDGTVVAIIDNEFDYDHEFLQASSDFSGRLSKDDIKSMSPFLSAGPYVSDKCYLSEKIPYRFNYGERNYNTNSEVNTLESHGTHVAGIIAGNSENTTIDLYTPKGTAPDTQLILMSTYNLYNDELLAAYDDVLYLGADVVNASYGSSNTAVNNSAEQTAINNITAAGTIFCAAAGNSGKYSIVDKLFTDYSTSGNPDNVNSSFSVGSADNITYLSENNLIKLSDGSEEVVINGSPIGINELSGLTFEYVPIPGYGSEEDFDGLDLTGKIALIKRGEILFAEKMNNAMMADAEGIIIYNNVDDDSDLTSIESTYIPSGMISKAAGEKMLALSDKTVTFIKEAPTIEIDETTNMSSFSSWGFTEQLLLKPDISGFGGNIVSSIADTNHIHNSYSIYSGTSMASPQIAGISSLLIEHIKNHPEKYNITNRSEYQEIVTKLLMSTATPIYTSDDMEIASPRVQGNGLANIENAINTPCYISTDSEKDACRPKLSLGDGYNKNYTLKFNVTNLSDNDTEYDLSINLFKDEADEDGSLAWNTLRLSEGTDYSVTYKNQKGSTIKKATIPAGQTVKLSANITLSDDIYNKIIQDGGRFIDGFVRLTSEENPNLTLSYMAFCGNWADAEPEDVLFDFAYNNPDAEYASFLCDSSDNISGANLFDFSLSEPAFSPSENNGDNVFDDIVLNLYFKRRCYDIKAKIYNSEGKIVYEEFLGDFADRMFDINETQMGNDYILHWDFKENGIINNNAEYTVEISAVLPLSEKSIVIGSQKFIIDTQKPVIKNVGKIDIFGTEYLIIDAQDNNQLQGAVNYFGPTNTLIDFVSASSSATKGRLIIETNNSKLGSEVEVYDIAGNHTTVNTKDAKYSLSLESENSFGFAATDEEDFFSEKIQAVDEKGNHVDLDFSGNITPEEAYESYGINDVAVNFLIEGHEAGSFIANAGIRGDANLDGVCNVRDAAYIAQMLSKRNDDKYYTFTSSLGGYLADFNHDNQMSVRDAAAIARYLAAK